MYAFPNVILPFIGGIMVDKIGTTPMLVFLITDLVFGSFLIYYGCVIELYNVVLLGRFIFGIGSETMLIASCNLM